ncbi:MAG: hypothetical protein ACFFB3_24350 [Candidatus Hodarchaeota archaeon]
MSSFGRELTAIKEELVELLNFLSSFHIDGLKQYFNVVKLKQISEGLDPNLKDLNLKRFQDREVSWDRIVASISPKSGNFGETFKDGWISHPRHLRSWYERQRRAKTFHPDFSPDYTEWLLEQSDYHKLLNCAKIKYKLDFSDISYLFYWISNLARGLHLISDRLSKFESYIGSEEEKKLKKKRSEKNKKEEEEKSN